MTDKEDMVVCYECGEKLPDKPVIFIALGQELNPMLFCSVECAKNWLDKNWPPKL